MWWFDRQWNPVPDPTIEYAPTDLLKLAHDVADKEKGHAKCYFIGGDDGPIKIGYSVDVGRRLKALQLACPVILKVLALASGGIYREAAYHMQFEDYRLHGEWFERCPAIEAEIARLG